MQAYAADHGARTDLPRLRTVLDAFLKRYPDAPETPAAVLAVSETHETLDDEASWRIMTEARKTSSHARKDPKLLIQYAYAAAYRGETDGAKGALERAMARKLDDDDAADAHIALALAYQNEHEIEKGRAALATAKTLATRSGRGEDLLRIATDLTSGGSTFDPRIEHRPLERPKPSFSPLLATGLTGGLVLGATGGALALSRRRRRAV